MCLEKFTETGYGTLDKAIRSSAMSGKTWSNPCQKVHLKDNAIFATTADYAIQQDTDSFQFFPDYMFFARYYWFIRLLGFHPCATASLTKRVEVSFYLNISYFNHFYQICSSVYWNITGFVLVLWPYVRDLSLLKDFSISMQPQSFSAWGILNTLRTNLSAGNM